MGVGRHSPTFRRGRGNSREPRAGVAGNADPLTGYQVHVDGADQCSAAPARWRPCGPRWWHDFKEPERSPHLVTGPESISGCARSVFACRRLRLRRIVIRCEQLGRCRWRRGLGPRGDGVTRTTELPRRVHTPPTWPPRRCARQELITPISLVLRPRRLW